MYISFMHRIAVCGMGMEITFEKYYYIKGD